MFSYPWIIIITGLFTKYRQIIVHFWKACEILLQKNNGQYDFPIKNDLKSESDMGYTLKSQMDVNFIINGCFRGHKQSFL